MAGRVWSLDGLTLEAVRVSAGARLTRHEHNRPHVCAIVAGSFDESHNRGRKRCCIGTTRLSPSGDRHTIEFGSEGAQCLIVTIDDDALHETRSAFRERTFIHDEWVATVARRAFRAVQTCDATDTLMLEAIGSELIAQLARRLHGGRVGPPPAWLRHVRDRLADAFETAISMRALANEAGVSREHLARAFRLHYGVTAEEFLRSARLGAACRLLTTHMSLSSIAAACGFSDQSHFTRWCVRQRGLSPAALRRAGADVTCVQDF